MQKSEISCWDVVLKDVDLSVTFHTNLVDIIKVKICYGQQSNC